MVRAALRENGPFSVKAYHFIDGENAHVGFVTVADLPYVDLVAAARDANLSVLRELHLIASPGVSE